ncbi:Kexin [Nakaseomyces bracarensis]|uniref:Kexin n=1 Tax=Nakaseomyces bracarensis TaxID=273131 RepID=A0ABR4NYA4_9SACH
MRLGRSIQYLALAAWFGQGLSEVIPEKNFTSREYFAIESELSKEKLLALHPSWRFEHGVRGLDNHYVFSSPKQEGRLSKRDLETSDHILFSELLTPERKLQKRGPVPPMDSSMSTVQDLMDRIEINDPLFTKQWHLLNPSFPGKDINVKDVWLSGITGRGVVAAIVDDGVDYESPDLKDNFSPEGSWDFNENKNLPKPLLVDDTHGTRCAGEIAAGKNNNFCGVGIAYNAKVSGLRILSGLLTSEDEAASLVHALDVNDIYSCSWGPPDDGKHLQGPSPLVRKALIKGTNEGRNKKGAIYVFASGNGGHNGDNCNYDGYTNSIYSITVGAVDHKDLHPPYSESCSAVMVVTYSSGSGEYIHSTDIKGTCSDRHGGTSAAAPIAAGIYALVLEANPSLTWRDLQYLTILSSDPVTNNLNDGNWQETAMKRQYSHTYGYGKLNAHKIVEMAKTWKNVNPQAWFFSQEKQVNKANDIDDINSSIESVITISKEDLNQANLKNLEHITVTVDIETTDRGQTIIDLISPSGIVSHLGVVRRFDNSEEGFRGWTFMSVAHWGESGVGDWKLVVKSASDSNEVQFNSWKLATFGVAEKAERAVPYEFGMEYNSPNESSDKTNDNPEPEEEKPEDSTDKPEEAIENPGSEQEKPDQGDTTEEGEGKGDEIYNPDQDNTDSHKQHSSGRLPPIPQGIKLIISVFLLICVFLLLHFMFFVRARRRIKRSRAAAYDYDIIDTDSDHDSNIDDILANMPDTFSVSEIDDNDFDLSDEDKLSNSGPVGKNIVLDELLLETFNSNGIEGSSSREANGNVIEENSNSGVETSNSREDTSNIR